MTFLRNAGAFAGAFLAATITAASAAPLTSFEAYKLLDKGAEVHVSATCLSNGPQFGTVIYVQRDKFDSKLETSKARVITVPMLKVEEVSTTLTPGGGATTAAKLSAPKVTYLSLIIPPTNTQMTASFAAGFPDNPAKVIVDQKQKLYRFSKTAGQGAACDFAFSEVKK